VLPRVRVYPRVRYGSGRILGHGSGTGKIYSCGYGSGRKFLYPQTPNVRPVDKVSHIKVRTKELSLMAKVKDLAFKGKARTKNHNIVFKDSQGPRPRSSLPCKKSSNSPSLKAHGAALISVSSPSAGHQPKLQDHGYGASASRGMPIYSPAFTGTH